MRRLRYTIITAMLTWATLTQAQTIALRLDSLMLDPLFETTQVGMMVYLSLRIVLFVLSAEGCCLVYRVSENLSENPKSRVVMGYVDDDSSGVLPTCS